jgi:hypothetical protein
MSYNKSNNRREAHHEEDLQTLLPRTTSDAWRLQADNGMQTEAKGD